DLAKEVVAVALLGGLATLAAGLGPAHRRCVPHPTPPSRTGCPGSRCVNHLNWSRIRTRMLRGMHQLSPAQREALGALLNAAPFAKVVRDLGRRSAERGHELYLVGGTVRDALLDRTDPDADIDLTTDATPDQILAVVRSGNWGGGGWLEGVRFGTVGVRKGDF